MNAQANVTRLLIDEPPLQVIPSLAVAIGLNEAIVVQQVHYWQRQSKNVRDGKQWVYNTLGDWQKQFPFWSTRTIRRIFDALEEQGLLVIGNFNDNALDRTAWYAIDYDRLAEKISSLPCGQVDHMGGSDPLPCGQVDHMHVDNLSTSTIYTETTITENSMSDAPKPKRKHREVSPKKETPSTEMFSRLCFVLYGHQNFQMLTDKQRGLLNAESKRLREKASASPDDLGEWYKQVWRHQWPGSTGQKPSVAQVLAGVTEYIESGRKVPTVTNGKADIPNTHKWDNCTAPVRPLTQAEIDEINF